MMKKLLIMLAILISGCSAMQSTHETINEPVNCSAMYYLDNLGYSGTVPVKLTRMYQDRFGKVFYQARSNIDVIFAGRGKIPSSQLKDIECE
ncbi:hypothetical protein [Providencia phage PSTCR7]|uniref:Uncharacterized protein n=1 Tax=Providencia phage PSTCR7 TaxID=2783549 RepID=A0A7S9SWH9_9CAUD|nr:hypothetical protein PQD10_gp83 [Providencia phage PSTCR7]QPI18535.1 hypothetical protein [Providencia phage PSTCR7]